MSPSDGPIFFNQGSEDLRDGVLPHSSYNPEGAVTIVFIHGAFQCRREWNLVVQHLPKKYHLLIPDLPGHGESLSIQPFSVSYAARLIAILIEKYAHNGRAHIVGLSLGAHVAIQLSSSHPEVVHDMFISGFEIYNHNALSPYIPHILWTMQRIENVVPRSLIRWLMDGADLERVDPHVCTLQLCQQIVDPMTETQWPSPWRARTLIVAAGKGGLIPSSDHPDDAKRLAQIGKEANGSTFAVTHPDMRHPWNRQAPKLFAQTTQAWFDREKLPDGFRLI